MSVQAALILFAHGARDPQWAVPFERIREMVAQSLPQIAVELAFLERMTPDFAAAVERVIGAGAQRVTVVPLFLGTGGHVKEDIAGLVEQSKQRHASVAFALASPIGEDAELVAAIADWVVREHGN